MGDNDSTVLERVRIALSGTPRGPRRIPATQHCVRVHEGLVDLFVERVADHRASVRRICADSIEAALAELLGDRPTAVPDNFGWAVPHRIGDADLEAGEWVPAVVSLATFGIATTGSLVLTHPRGGAERALMVTPDRHICVVHEDRVLLGMPEALAFLGPHRPQTWINPPDPLGDEQPPDVGPGAADWLDVLVVSAGG